MKRRFSSFFSGPPWAERMARRLNGREFNWAEGSVWLFRALVVVLVLGVVHYLYATSRFLVFPYEFKGWAEGQIMYNAWTLAQGRNFYVDPMKEPVVAYCYTPGLQLLIAPLLKVFGLKLWVGRAVAMAGLFFTLFLMAIAVSRRSGRRLDGLVAAGIVLATYGIGGSHLDDVHPDFWTIAWGLFSLFLAESALRKKWLIVPAAAAGAFSFFTKQTGLSFAAGAAVFLFLHSPRRGIIYTILAAALIAGGFAGGQALTGGRFWEYVIGSAAGQPLNLWLGLESFAKMITMMMGGIVVLCYLLLERPTADYLLSPYALSLPVVAVVYGAGSFRLGGSVSNFYPALVLAAVLVGAGLAHVRGPLAEKSPRVSFLLLALLLLQSALFVSKPSQVPTADHYRVMRKIEKIVRETPGEILVFYRISFAYLNGRPVYDNYGAMVDHSNWKDYRRLENQLRRRFFSRLLIPKEAMDMWLVKTPLYPALMENYEQEEFIAFPAWELTVPLHVFRRKP